VKIVLTIAAAVLMSPLLVMAAVALGPAALVILFLVLCTLLVLGVQRATSRLMH
jgi:hypothetical protein